MRRNLNYTTYTTNNQIEELMLQSYSKANVSISIASAITAYSRIHMTQFKNNQDLTGDLLYTDTDSIVTSKPLPSKYVGAEIGELKLEKNLAKGVFIAPKVYGGILNTGEAFTKVKGFKNNVTFDQLKQLLNKSVDHIDLNQEKWYKSLSEGTITLKDQIYTLQVTENKRKLVYYDDYLIRTEPFIVSGKEIINKESE